MNDKSHLTSKHVLVCVAVIALAITAVVAGAGAGLLLLVLLCPLMMGGMNGRRGGS